EARLIVPFTYAMNKSPENLEHIAALGFAQLGSMALLVPFIPVLLRYGECILLRDLVIAFDFQEAFNLVDRFVRREHGRIVAEPQRAFQRTPFAKFLDAALNVRLRMLQARKPCKGLS